jgi:uncharacterized protein YraI
MRVRGTVEAGATYVGGAVTGIVSRHSVKIQGCTNLTTGQQVKLQGKSGAKAASCVAAGLVVHLGDLIQISVQGVAE